MRREKGISMQPDGKKALAPNIEMKLDEADKAAEKNPVRLTHEEVFDRVRKRTHC